MHCGKTWEVNLNCFMRECDKDEWKAVKEFSDRMFKEEEIVPIEVDEKLPLNEGEKIYLKSKEVSLYHEPYYPKLEKVSDGTLFLTSRRLIFLEDDGKVLSYNFSDIRGNSTERNYIFQIVLDDDIARFEMRNESCYKWEILYRYIRKKEGFKPEEE